MGRKFSFSLAPLVPSKTDKPAVAEPIPVPTDKTTHKRHVSKDSVASLNMSFISRQRLDPRTEQELRAACAVILQNFKPSDHDIPDVDPKLDFHGPHKRREHRTEPSQIRAHKPTGAPGEPESSSAVRKDSHRTASVPKSYPDLLLRANTGRRRVENTQNTETEADARRIGKLPTTDAPRPLARADTDTTDDVVSVGTPLSTSTDTRQYSNSTAPTSVAVTHRSSKRTSRQGDNPAAIADAQAAEWMRQELEKRRQQLASQPQTRPETSERPPSRTSIRSSFKDYIFPGSKGLSRSQSRDSLRSSASGQPKRSGSSQGWRSWGLNRMTSSRSSSRPGTSSGRKKDGDNDKKGELNLNRELPPLPSLDNWKEPEPPKVVPKAPAQGAHIASLMRTQDQQQPSCASAARQHHRRSGSDSLVTRYANAYGPAPAPRVMSPTQQAFAQKSTALVPEDQQMLDFDHMVTAMSSSRNLDEQLKLRIGGQTLQRSGSTISRLSADGRVLGAPNFSRKISTDGPAADRPFDANSYAYPNIVQITATHAQKEPEQKSRLKKVFSAWVLKKEKKSEGGDWMHKLEKEGIRTGVMMQDEAALPPVVRF